MAGLDLDRNRLSSAEKALLEKLKGLTPARMEVLCAVVEKGSYVLAAAALHREAGTIAANIRDLERIFGVALVGRTRGEQSSRPTEEGLRLAAACRQILETQLALIVGKRPTSVRYLPHHSCTVLPTAKALETLGFPVELDVLGEHHRAMDHFIDHALRPVVAGMFDVAIGVDFPSGVAEPEYDKVKDKLRRHPLYEARLEALIHLDDPRYDGSDFVTIAELARYKLLTSPLGTRSRRYLELAAGAHAGDRPLDIRMEGYESKMLVIGTYSGLGTTVLPSDMAIQFDAGWAKAPLAGPPAKEYRWLPVRDIEDKLLQYDVVAYTVAEASPGALLFIKELRDQVRRVMTEARRAEVLIEH